MNSIIRASVLILGFMVAHISFLSCNNENSNANSSSESNTEESIKVEKPKKLKNILFYGNSLTAGYGLEDKETFPSLIQEFIDSLELNYHVINGGLSGETTSGGRERIDWVLQQPIDVFVLELGANDMLRGLDLASTRENLDSIVTKVKKRYPQVIIFLAEMKAAPNMGTAYIVEFSKIYTDLAQSHDLKFIPFFLEGVAGNPSLLLPDGKHPNADGQKIVANNIWKVIKDYL